MEIGVFGEPALFEHILQGPLAPAPARLRATGQRIAEPLRLALYLVLAFSHFLDHAGELPEGIDPFFLERLDLVLVALEPVADGGEQRLQLLLARLFGMAEPFLGALEEGFLRLAQHGSAGVLELLEEIGSRFFEQPLLLLKSGALGAELRIFGARGIELRAEPISPRRAFAQRGDLDPCLAQFGKRALEFARLLGPRPLGLGEPRAQIGERTRGKEPPSCAAESGTEDECKEGKNLKVHCEILHGTYGER